MIFFRSADYDDNHDMDFDDFPANEDFEEDESNVMETAFISENVKVSSFLIFIFATGNITLIYDFKLGKSTS